MSSTKKGKASSSDRQHGPLGKLIGKEPDSVGSPPYNCHRKQNTKNSRCDNRSHSIIQSLKREDAWMPWCRLRKRNIRNVFCRMGWRLLSNTESPVIKRPARWFPQIREKKQRAVLIDYPFNDGTAFHFSSEAAFSYIQQTCNIREIDV